MIFLDPNNPIIIEARQKHVDKLLGVILNEVDSLPDGDLKVFLNEQRVTRILTDLPNELEKHHSDWLDEIGDLSQNEWKKFLVAKAVKKNRSDHQKELIKKYEPIIKKIQAIFKYTGGFSRKTASYSTYDLAKKLNVNTCVYCNRIYTKTVANPTKITRPEFDHWYPKSSYPILALSFYNLIPSCHICNSSVKSNRVMNTDEFLHPYIPEDIYYKFSYRIERLNKYSFIIKRANPSKEHNTIEAFQIEKIYETHMEEINDLVRLRKLYSFDYLLKLKKLLSDVDKHVSMEEIYRLAFGTHYDEESFLKRPLSKMKRDILEELGLILI